MTDKLRGQLVKQNTLVEEAPLQEKTILFHQLSNRFCILNRTSSFIWHRIKSPMSPEQIATELAASFAGVAPADALRDVYTALTTLAELDIVITHNSE